MPEVQTDHSETAELSKPQLRMVDLNLLTVFDAVMQEQNITRAAHVLGMSQPAVSNAVARLKVMFNDELFCSLWPWYSTDCSRISTFWLSSSGIATSTK